MAITTEYIQFIVTVVKDTPKALLLQIGDNQHMQIWVPKSALRDEKGGEYSADPLCIGIVVKMRIAAWFAKKSGVI